MVPKQLNQPMTLVMLLCEEAKAQMTGKGIGILTAGQTHTNYTNTHLETHLNTSALPWKCFLLTRITFVASLISCSEQLVLFRRFFKKSKVLRPRDVTQRPFWRSGTENVTDNTCNSHINSYLAISPAFGDLKSLWLYKQRQLLTNTEKSHMAQHTRSLLSSYLSRILALSFHLIKR